MLSRCTYKMYRSLLFSTLKLTSAIYLFLVLALVTGLGLLHYVEADNALAISGAQVQQNLALPAEHSLQLMQQADSQWLALVRDKTTVVWQFSRQDLAVLQYFTLGLLLSYWPFLLLALPRAKSAALIKFLVSSAVLYLLIVDWLTLGLAGSTFLYLASFLCLFCWGCWTLERQQWLKPANNKAELLLAYASQSGKAAQLARAFAKQLKVSCHALDLARATPSDLQRYQHGLFMVSTYGEGEPPESVRSFFNKLKKSQVDLQHLRYSVLALGDDSYPEFCAFGHALDQQLQRLGAEEVQVITQVNREDPQQINQWWQQSCLHFGLKSKDIQQQWLTAKVISNQRLNPQTPERPAHHIKLQLEQAHYLPGDLLEVLAKGTDTPRTYSIASNNRDNQVELLVRKLIKDNGETGLASGYLAQLQSGEQLKVAFREHPNFHLPTSDVPLILIAAGTGLAPFIGFLQQRARDNTSSENWLFMGERYPEQDNYFQQQLDALQQQGVLTQRFHAWSKHPEQSCYVPELLQQQAEAIRKLVLEQEACIYLCGNAKGFGASVLTSLEQLFGHHWTQDIVQQRIKKDLY